MTFFSDSTIPVRFEYYMQNPPVSHTQKDNSHQGHREEKDINEWRKVILTSLKFRASKQRTLTLKGPLKTALLTLAPSPTPTVYTQCSSPRASDLRVEMCRFLAGTGTSLSRTLARCFPRWPHPMMPTLTTHPPRRQHQMTQPEAVLCAGPGVIVL